MSGDSQVTLKTVFRFGSSRVAVMGERALAVSVEWGGNCVILSSAQRGSKGIRLICGKAACFLFLETMYRLLSH